MIHVAKKLPQKLAPSGWLAILPPRTENAPLEGETTADIAIIGAGYAGLSAAHRLIQLDPKLRITVLEALAIGEGANGRNSGFMIDLPHDISSDSFSDDATARTKQDITINRTAIAFARNLAEEHGWDRSIFDSCGKYSFATGKKGDDHLIDFSKQLIGLSENHTLLNAEESQAITGSTAFTSGLFTPGAMMIQPAAYIRAFAEAIQKTVKIHERSPVISINREQDAWTIKTPKGSLSAKKIILATNGHAESFGFFPRKLLHLFTFASMTEEFDAARLGGERQWGATPAHPMGTTMRRIRGAKGDRLVIRFKYSYNPSLEISDNHVTSAGHIHDQKFATRFPMLQGVQMQYRWAGALALTWNTVPAFGELEPGLFAACACNGIGLTKSTASGMAAAELAIGQKTRLTEFYAAVQHPKSIPPQPLAVIGARATIAFRTWQAGTE